MANYSLVANTTYKARSFEDLIRPYALYTQEYRDQEGAIADLAAKADVWKSMANAQTDPIAYARISNYADALRNQANVMASRGLDSSSRQAMLNLKRRYSSEITPVEQAFKTRQLQAAEQQQARMKDPTLMMSRRADATSLDDYIDNPTLGYDAYSGALLTQQVGTAAAKLATELREYGNGKRLDAFTKTWLQKHGYSASEVAFAINNPDDPRANNVLNTIVSNVMADSGMDKWADNRTLSQAYNYARQGLWQAVGQTTVQQYADEGAKLAAEEAMQIRKENRARKAAEEEAVAKELNKRKEGISRINPVSLYSNDETASMSTEQSLINQWVKKGWLIGKGGTRGYALSTKGIAAINAVSRTTDRDGRVQSQWANRTFRDYMIQHKIVTPNKKSTTEIGDYYNGYRKESFVHNTADQKALYNRLQVLNTGYDAKRDTAFLYNYKSGEDQQRVKDAIIGAAGNADLQVVDFTSGAGWNQVGILKLSDLASSDYKVLNSLASEYGQVFTVADKNGNTYRINAPGVNRNKQASAVDFYREAANLQKELKKKESTYLALQRKIKEQDLSVQQLSDAELNILLDYDAMTESYKNALLSGQEDQGFIGLSFGTPVETPK